MNELDKLRDMLTKAGIPYEDEQEPIVGRNLISLEAKRRFGDAGNWWRNQVIYGRTRYNDWKWNGSCQYDSYGAAEGMIESHGELGVDEEHEPKVVTAEEAFVVIKADYDKRNNE